MQIAQEAFVESMRNRFGVNKSFNIPATPVVELGPKEKGKLGGDWPCKDAVVSLMWLSTMTMPGISNAVSAVAHNSHNPRERYWTEIKNMVYLRGTRFSGSTFERGSGLKLNAYSEADYADKSNDRRSVSGTIIILRGADVSWAGSTHRWVTLSTAEAEYVALEKGVFTGTVLWILCPELYKRITCPAFEDNQRAIALAANPRGPAIK